MPVGNYPTPEFGGPPIAVIQELPIEYPSVIEKIFKDEGASTGLSNANGVRRWLILHHGLFPAEATTLDNHNSSAKHNYEGFSFKNPRTGVTYTDVHYEEYEYPQHRRYTWTERRTVLIKRPI